MERPTAKSDADSQSDRPRQARQQRSSSSGSSSSSSDGEGSSSDPGRLRPQQPPPTPPWQARPAAEGEALQKDLTDAPEPKPREKREKEKHDKHDKHEQRDHHLSLHKAASSASTLHGRPKAQKHVVGGGGSTARLHARVPSSKALHKAVVHHHHHSAATSTTTTTKAQQPALPSHSRKRSSVSPPHPSDFADRFPFAAAPPPIDPPPSASRPQLHRRSTSTAESKSQRSSTATSSASLVRRNQSATALPRNRSHADVTKRLSQGHAHTSTHARPSAGNLKRTHSNPAVSSSDRLRPLISAAKAPHHGQVHFEIGSPDAPDDDEWVDAGSSNLSGSRKSNSGPHRDDDDDLRHEVVTQPPDTSEHDSGSDSNSDSDSSDDDRPAHVELRGRKQPQPSPLDRTPKKTTATATTATTATSASYTAELARPSSSASASAPSAHRRTGSTSRLLLPRTPPSGAPPKMSSETASAIHNAQSPPSDAGSNRHSSRNTQPQPQSQSQATTLPGGSGDRDAMTSRFITTGSHESASATTAGGSYYTTSSSRPSTGRQLVDDRSADGILASSTSATHMGIQRPRSVGGSISPQIDGEDGASMGTDERRASTLSGVGGSGSSSSTRTNPRRTPAPPAEFSRTQQKLNLERQSSSIDRSARPHQGPSAGPLLGAADGMHDPRIGKLMEKTGMEYYVVRRYQNPITRSLSRLTDRLGGDKNWRIPAAHGGSGSRGSHAGLAANAAATATAAPPSRHGASRSSTSGLSQSLRERDIRRGALQSATAAAAHNPAALARSKTFANGSGDTASNLGAAYAPRLSGASLVEGDGDDEDSTAALLRRLWDKNLYLETSHD